jgi:ribosomal peptide maturation radical SAM protein 1
VSDVVLVSMPFGPVFAPSLALSLLKAGLAREGIDASLHYFTIRFAEIIGQAFYCGIASDDKPALEDLPGEWLFSRALFDTTGADDTGYVETLLRDYYSDALIARLLRARQAVDAFLDECAETVLREEPKLVGFTSVFQQHAASLALARRLKHARPSTFIVFGGANCEGVMGAETIRSFGFVDAAVSGEADVVFPELVKQVIRGKCVSHLQGVRSRRTITEDFAFGRFGNAPMVTDMDRLPYPDYSDYFAQFRASRYDRDWQPTLFFETARGCWWGERMHCTFCGLNGSTMAFRSKSSSRALAEVTDLNDRYPGCDIQTVDNILDLRYFKDFIPALARRKLNVGVFWETKSNLNKQQVRLLRDAGIREIQPGIESLSDSVLKLMQKGVSGLQNIQLLKWCRELGLEPRWNVLWGFPGEAPEEYARLARVVPLLTHLHPPTGSSTIRLDRFSPNFFDAERRGFIDVRPLPAYRHVYPLSDDAVANLACYFSYRYREPRNVDEYVRPFDREIVKWKRLREQSALLSVEADGHLVLVDLRPGDREPFILLGGLLRTLYVECDGVRDLFQLAQRASSAGYGTPDVELEQALAPLVERGVLLRDGSRYLALAIPVGEHTPPRAIARRFRTVVSKVGTRNGCSWIVPSVSIGASLTGARPARGTSNRFADSRFSVDARGRLVITASERSRQRRRSG